MTGPRRRVRATGPRPWPGPTRDDWPAFVNAPMTESELAAIRRSLRSNRPYGTGPWAAATTSRLSLESSLRPVSTSRGTCLQVKAGRRPRSPGLPRGIQMSPLAPSECPLWHPRMSALAPSMTGEPDPGSSVGLHLRKIVGPDTHLG